jgi:hypothetical protein
MIGAISLEGEAELQPAVDLPPDYGEDCSMQKVAVRRIRPPWVFQKKYF